MIMGTPIHLLLAATIDAGAHCARYWGWEPATVKVNGRVMFIDPDGDLVLPTSSTDLLRALAPDRKIYLGEAWAFAHGDVKEALRLHVARGGKLLAVNWKEGKIVGFFPPPYAI